jgi:4'-phosphopantetheinyl transferase
VWQVSLGQCSEADIDTGCWPLLSNDERDQAERYRMPGKRREYIATRGALRRIVGGVLGVDPAALSFAYGAHGKPSLADPWRQRKLSFNVSHSGDVALVAATTCGAIGVDVERVRADKDHLALARRYFSRRENEMLLELPAERRVRAFFDCWTRKEAFIKAEGRGVSLGLDRFDVTLAPGEQARLLATAWDAEEAARWQLVDLPLDDDYAAALAVGCANSCEVRRWRFAW